MTVSNNLLPEPPPTLLPENPEADKALSELDLGTVTATEVAARFPAQSGAWAVLADLAFEADDVIASYAYARTGYHRGLDALRRNGWKGVGPVPWSHHPNRGFLRCLHALARAADAIGEKDEAERCAQFLRDCDPTAAAALS